MKTYHSTQRILMEPITFVTNGSDFVYTARDKEEEKFIESTTFFKRGVITTDGVDVAEKEVIEYVTNCKQAIEWLVANKGIKRGVLSREQILSLAEENNVEFPNLAKK